MASFQKIIILGHLGQDPETRYLPDGTAVTNISLATSETWKDKQSGEKKERVEWWRVVCFGRIGEVAGEYLKKGSPVLIEGRGQTEKWTDKDGVERYTFKVRADQIRLLGSRGDSEGRSPPSSAPGDAPAAGHSDPKPAAKKHAPTGGKFDDMESDIPF